MAMIEARVPPCAAALSAMLQAIGSDNIYDAGIYQHHQWGCGAMRIAFRAAQSLCDICRSYAAVQQSQSALTK